MYITKYLSKQGRSSMWLHISCICVRSCIVCICLHCACLQQDGFTRHLTKDTGVVSKYRVAIEFQFFLTNEQQIIPWTTGLRCIVCIVQYVQTSISDHLSCYFAGCRMVFRELSKYFQVPVSDSWCDSKGDHKLSWNELTSRDGVLNRGA